MATYGTYKSPGGFKLTIFGIVIVGLFFTMFLFTRGMYRENRTERPNATARAAERIKARDELRKMTGAALANGGMVDTNKGIVRIPIARAMQMTVDAYQNPQAAHSNLVARAQKAAEPAPQPSFE
jgi:hypothetical protein